MLHRSSRGPLAAILPLFPRRIQLPIPLGENLLLMPAEHVPRRDVSDRTVQTDVVVMVYATLLEDLFDLAFNEEAAAKLGSDAGANLKMSLTLVKRKFIIRSSQPLSHRGIRKPGSESMLEKTDHIMATYMGAADEFGRSAKEFLQHVNLLHQAWNAYEQAMTASAELRTVLDNGDENLRTLMTQLEQAVSSPFGRPVDSGKKLEALKDEVMKASAAGAGAANPTGVTMLP
jgi:hypothetical protein